MWSDISTISYAPTFQLIPPPLSRGRFDPEDPSWILERTTDCILILDRAWRIAYMNGRAAAFIGRGAELGANILRLYPESDSVKLRRRCEVAFATQEALSFEEYLGFRGTWLEVHVYPSPTEIAVLFRDITERKRTETELARLAYQDALTGLPNRRRFHEELDAALGKRRSALKATLMYLDLDNFKNINDTLGHPFGDELLKRIGDRLRNYLGPKDFLARIGGDEFAVIRFGRDRDGAAIAAGLIKAIADPVDLDGYTVRMGASIGVVPFPSKNRFDRVELLKRVDIALYAAKAKGRGTFCLYEPSMADAILTREAIKAGLRDALANGEFRLAYQPIVGLRSGKVTGFEALLRWENDKFGRMGPQLFIPIAEECGVINEIGEWVIEQACLEASRWPGNLKVAVNLSAVQFCRSTLPQTVADALAKSRLKPSRLELEITESVLLQDTESNIAILSRLREMGVLIALDDFGTGFSSLGYLSRFKFDKVKIDRSFIAEMTKRLEPKAVVRAVAGLGRALGITITAEGVETREQQQMVRRKGCHEAQGYLYSKPIAAVEIAGFLRGHERPISKERRAAA
jgi:diguanylate cyclase (GGDEF)-like protein/PAS domain S-box-containing protein